MTFEETGLPNSALVKKAYSYALNAQLATAPEHMEGVMKELDEEVDRNMAEIERAKAADKIDAARYAALKESLAAWRREQEAAAPEMIRRALARDFANRAVRAAQELKGNTENVAQEAVAAVLLVESCRSPHDFARLQKEFGPSVFSVVADLLHMESYPTLRAEFAKSVGGDVKKAHGALTAAEMARKLVIAERFIAAKRQPRLAEGEEKRFYTDIALVWGSDDKMDARLLSCFNTLAEKTKSLFRIERDAAGQPVLKELPPPPPVDVKKLPAPKPPKPPSDNLGGDVF